ncbi:MAG: putative beta-lysine N-acetyltransferase [Eubacteriales bacterium]
MDIVSTIGKTVIHHGDSNKRVYLMSMDTTDTHEIIKGLDTLARDKGYTKIIAKIPEKVIQSFEMGGYIEEAMIPNLYKGEENGHFMCRYLDEKRRQDPDHQRCMQILEDIDTIQATRLKGLGKEYCVSRMSEKHVDDMVLVYREVFKSYPFPIHDRAYLLRSMKNNLLYYGIWHKDKLVALASIELAKKYSNAELTDFATISTYRGKGLATHLLKKMEIVLHELNIYTAYTIARAKSFGMNAVFSKQGYTYGGMLINNTDIAGEIESMNIWYKSL